MKRIYETFWCAWIYETMFEFIGGWEVFYREMMMKWEPPRKALIFEFASFKHERSTTRHSNWSGIACKLQRCQWKLLQKLLFLMPSMMEITSSSSGFQFFFWGTMPLNCPRGKYPGTVIYYATIHLLYTYYTMLMKNVIQSPDWRLSRKVYRGHLQCGQTRKSTECVIVNVSDVVEG